VQASRCMALRCVLFLLKASGFSCQCMQQHTMAELHVCLVAQAMFPEGSCQLEAFAVSRQWSLFVAETSL
jgi:hypothetical protein